MTCALQHRQHTRDDGAIASRDGSPIAQQGEESPDVSDQLRLERVAAALAKSQSDTTRSAVLICTCLLSVQCRPSCLLRE